ncbi:MAG: beta strand repeat-containing protein [Novosphingobium sp.]
MPGSSKLSDPIRRRPGMGRLLAGISVGAASLVLATAPAPVLAQAVNGTPTPQFGIGGISRSTPGLDAVFVTGSEGLIDWTATDSGGVFLPEGNTLRFIYDGSTPYTVLNRITDTAVGGPLSISGTVESSSQGNIWFYNAGGWVVGPKGVFNVGSLVLSSLPIAVDPATDTVSRLYGDTNEIRFGTALDPKSLVSIQSGASINATLANSSYVALVAPRVEQAGTVRVNGSAAYVAASAATMTINSGLFDIVVDSGSEDDVGVAHTGSTTWAADAGSTDASHGVYLVAVPKNQAMTAVVSGRLGYDSATTASVVDGSIVLSAGHNVSGGNIVSDSVVGANASLAISNLTVGATGAINNLIGSATGNVAIDAATGDTIVHGSVDLKAFGDLDTVIDGKSVTVEGDLLLASANGANSGKVSVAIANGGTLSVSGTLDLSSTALGQIQTDPLNGDALLAGSIGEDANSGAVSLTVTDGNVSAGVTNLTSSATSGVGQLAAGNATSGTATVSVTQTDGAASTFGVSFGALSISSSADNGFFNTQSADTGGTATSGAASLTVDGGAYTSNGVSLSSDAYTYSGTIAKALDASAGAVSISFANSNGSHQTGSIFASNYASASDGGIAALGNVSLNYDKVTSSTSDSFGGIFLDSYAYGDLVAPNTVSLNLTGGSQLETFGASVSLYASGRSATGIQRSGNVSFLSDASALSAGYLDLTSQAHVFFGSGSAAASGDVSAVIRAGSNLTVGSQANLTSSARGGSFTSGGSGTAGSVSFSLADSSFSGDLYLTSHGVAGSRTDAAGASGSGTGGAVSFVQTGKVASLTADTVSLLSLGQGGGSNEGSRLFLQPQAGDGATGQGGTTSFSLAEGTFNTSALSVASTGEGGDGENQAGVAPGKGGAGLGGTASLSVSGGILSAPDIKVQASGYGGDGAQADGALGIDGGQGGDGTGGTASANLTGGVLRTESLLVEANGNKSFTNPSFGNTDYFGNGGYEFDGLLKPGTGGLGAGGTALLTIDGGSLQAVEPYADVPPTVQVNAIGEGGPGGFAYSYSSGDALYSGSGGDGVGGSASIRYLSGTFDAAAIGVDASGLGGLAGNLLAQVEGAVNAGNGGSGIGGTALFEIASSLDQLTSLNDLRSVRIMADGVGTTGENGGIGGHGGNGRGGVARLLATGGTIAIADLTLSAQGTGSRGGDAQISGDGGRGGSGTGGVAQVVADGSGAQLSLQGPVLQVAGRGGAGGSGGLGADGNDVAGDGGDGGSGTGGEIGFLASNLGKLDVAGFSTGASFNASGQGGSGGLGGNAAANGGLALGDGGNGASGVGGTISATANSGGDLTFDSLTLMASGIGGVGAGRLEGSVSGTPNPSVGGVGGSGQGGTIRIVSSGAGSSVLASGFQASADGRGGLGAEGAGYTPSGQSTDGSAGGDGTGGTFSLLADLEGTVELAADSGNVSITASGFGGNGGRAQDAIGTSGASGGNGGDSGIGGGGTIQFNASRQGAATIGGLGSSTIVASGTGGGAGLGGNGAPATALGATGGNGGNAGRAWSGIGGDIAFGADGGTLDFGTLNVRAAGTTRVGDSVGAGGSGPGGSGLSGTRTYVLPNGGTIAFTASDSTTGGLGQITTAAATAEVTSTVVFLGLGVASSGAAGGISLANSSTAVDGGLHFGSFLGDALGFPAIVDPAIDISVTAGSIVVDTDLSLYARGNIAVGLSDETALTANFADLQSESGIDIIGSGTGRFSAGTINLFSFGSIAVASNGCTTAICRPVEASGGLTAYAFGDFSLSGPAELAGLGGIAVYAGGDVTGDAGTRYFSTGDIAIRAGGDATIRNITGANVIAEAGAIEDGSFIYYDGLLTLGEAEGGGLFSASGSLDLNSGGTVQTNAGVTFTAGRGFGIRSGNDILIGVDNAFTANTGLPLPPERVVFAAGGQAIAYSLGATDIAALSFGLGTTVAAGTGDIDLSAAAIDARPASFTGASFRADLTDSLTLGSVRRNEGGRLDPDCLEGAICIGNVDSAGFVSIGGGDFVPLDIHAAGTINGDSVLLRATGDITLGGSEVISQITAVDDLSITSNSGGIALLGNAGLTAGTLRLTAASNLSGTGVIEATRDDIGLSVGGDIDAGSLIAVGELTTVIDASGEAEGSFSAPGSMRTGVLSLGAPANISANGEIRIGALSLAGSDGTFTAGTALHLGTSAAVETLSLIAGAEATFGEIVADGNLTIEGQSVNGTSAIAGGALSITSPNLGAGFLQSAGNLTLTVTDTAALGTVTSTGGSVLIDPTLLTFDAISASEGISLAGGTITGGTLDAGTSIDVTATGTLSLTTAQSGTTMTLKGANLQAGALTSGGGVSLTAADLASISGAIRAGAGISVTAARFTAPLLESLTGPIGLSITGRADLIDVANFGGDLSIDAGTLRFTAVGASGAVRLRGADLAGSTVTSGSLTDISTSSIANIDTVTSGSSATINGPSVNVTKVSAGTFTDFGGQTINVGETTAGTTAFVDARDFTFDRIAASQSIEVLTSRSTTGGRIDAGTTLSISAAGDVKFGDTKAGDAITIAGANLDGLTITGDAGLSLTATNAINLGTVKVLGSFDLSGASLVLGTSNSGLDSTFAITGDATIGSITAGLASTGQNLVQIVVQALANSYTGGSLVPVFDVVQGQTITVSSSTDDLWSAGVLPRFSDGDGLIAFRLATAQDDSGVQPGTQIGAAFGNLTLGNFSAPFGALVGQIGNQNVLIGANGTVTIPATGTLSVGYWDSNAGDNTGSIAFTFGSTTGGGSVSNLANANVSTGGNLTIGSATATRAVGLDAGGALRIDRADAGTTLSLSGNTIDAGTLTAGSDISLASAGTSLIGTAIAGGRFSADIGAIDFTLIDAAGAVDIASLAGGDGGDLRSGASIIIDASGSIVIRDATAATNMTLTTSAAGDIAARTLVAGSDIGIEGRDITLASATAGANFRATVRSLVSPAINAGAAFNLSGTGAVEVGTVSAGTALSVTSQTLTFSRMVSTGTLNVGSTGNVTGGDLVATGTIRINSGLGRFVYGTLDGGDIAVVAGSVLGGAVRARAGDFNLGVAGDANIGTTTATGNISIDAQRLDFTTIAAGGNFGTTNAAMAGTSVAAGQDVDISSRADIALDSLSGASARINSSGIVNITGLRLSGAVSVSANAVGLDALGDLAIQRISADAGNVDVTAEGSITGNTINAVGDINLLARNGDVVISQLSAGYSDVFGDSIRPQATVTAGAVGQGDIDIIASGDIVINDVADAAKVFSMNAGDTIRINGLATGATMDLTSADLAIGSTGSLGETAHTEAIDLRSAGQGPVRLGDNIASTVSGYAISQAEFSRIRSRGDLSVRAAQDLLVGDLAVTAQSGTTQGQIGETGSLSLRSGGLVSFLGALSMGNASGNTLTVSSQNGVFLDASSGSIRLLDGELRAGTLAISGSGIAMVTRSAREDISQLTDTALITDRLGLNDGVTDGRTLVEADTIQLRSDREVYVQNTSIGSGLDDRRGLLVNSLSIGSRDGSQLDIVINGIVNGQTGVDAIEQIGFDEAFSDLSSVNGCVIVSSNTCNKLPFEIIELRDLVEEVLDTSPAENALQVVDSFADTSLIQLSPIAPAGFEPLIDEPVTGTGNDDILGEGKQEGE